MVFDLVKQEGQRMHFPYKPMSHGFSRREIQDTIRRMEVLMEDLEHLARRKEREKLELMKLPGTFIGFDWKPHKIQQASDACYWALADKGGIELQLPIVERALETAPEETPPLRHEDYYQRCQNLEERRGEYWRINPQGWNKDDRAAGIGMPTPENEKYWPTHQVPWQQGEPSPPLEPKPLTPPPCCPAPFDPPQEPSTPPKKTKKKRRRRRVIPPPIIYPEPSPDPMDLSSPSIGNLSLDAPSITSYHSTPAGSPENIVQRLDDVADELDVLNVQLMRMQMLAHDAADSPASVGEGDQGSGAAVCPEISEIPQPECIPRQSTPPPCPSGAAVCPEISEIPQPECSPRQSSPPPWPPMSPGQQSDFDDWSPGLLDRAMIQDEAFSPEYLSDDKVEDWYWSPGTLNQGMIQDDAFSPEQLGVDEMEIMMHDAVQRSMAAEVLDPCELMDEAFSPDFLDDSQIESMLNPEGLPGLLSTPTRQGLELLAGEPPSPELTSEERWNARCSRWRQHEERRQEEERRRAVSAHACQQDAASLFGIRPRGISAPPSSPPTRPGYQPETLGWGESPVHRISPPCPPTTTTQTRGRPVGIPGPTKVGRGKRLVRPKPNLPPMPDLYSMPPSRLLYPKGLGGPTFNEPTRPSTSLTIYNTRKREYEHLDEWVQLPSTAEEREKAFCKHRSDYRYMLRPGPGVVPPKPAPPPPPPPPEYGPEPENLSVYVPESVYESPDTLKQRIIEAIERFERKMEQVRQRLERRTRYRSPSSWVREEYTDEREAKRRGLQEKERRAETQQRKKWDNLMFCRFGAVPYFVPGHRFMRGISRTASTYRPKKAEEMLSKKKAPLPRFYDEPVQGPCMPWVYGSTRPPPRTAAGRISSPCEPAPRPPVRPVSTPPAGPCPAATPSPRAQPRQVTYGSARPPPRTASSYKYTDTPTGRPARDCPPMRRRRLMPSTPEMVYGSARPPPRTSACPRPQPPM